MPWTFLPQFFIDTLLVKYTGLERMIEVWGSNDRLYSYLITISLAVGVVMEKYRQIIYNSN